MSFTTLHDRVQSAGPTPKFLGAQTGTPRGKSRTTKNVNLSTQHFRLAHQRVSLDVDLAHKQLKGFTELTLIPTSSALRVIKLDAREMKIKEVYVNGTKLVNFVHSDRLYINDPDVFDNCVEQGSVNIFDVYSEKFDVHQHHLLRQKLNYIFGEFEEDIYDPTDDVDLGNTEELLISLPSKFLTTERTSLHTPASSIGTGFTPLQSRNKNTHGDSYAPIQVGIEYEVINPNNGVNFSCDGTDKRLWHVYTVNSEYNVSTSSWCPCVDNMWEKSTWSIELTVPRTTKEIENFSSEESSTESTHSENAIEEESATKNASDNESDEDDDEDDAENFDLFVCTSDSNNTKETPHPTDKSKKIVSWSIFNPVCAHHVGWVFGPFESAELQNLTGTSQNSGGEDDYEELEKEELGSSVTIHFLPGQESEARNTCIFAREALDFFSAEFGSYPFTTYGIVFVKGAAHSYNNFAGLTVLSDRLLYPENLIDPMFTLTENILECIAGQWSTINIVPQTYHDLWCTIGIARFMAFQFLRDLMGNNEFRYNIKRKMEKIVETDVSKQPLSLPYLRFPISETDLDFVRLKASVVLLILDRRMTKTDKSFGLARVLPKIFLQAMSGDLQNGTLSTSHFQYVCEKVNRNRLDNFFKQWVYGVGTPVFNITQRFNKKRSLIEVVIRQTQNQQHRSIRPKPETFMEEALMYLHDEELPPSQNCFLGPMTIRVHEADGTPYEHIVDIKDSLVKFDVQYNTKARRSRKNKEENVETNPIFSKLGDILMKEKDVKEWDFEEWPKRDEDLVDPYEWIRVDTDCEWIAKFNVRQPDYMFGSQLQQDRDIEAQCEAAKYFGEHEKPNKIYCTSLTRTLMDRRYHYGVRIAAAQALAKLSTKANSYFGLPYFLKAFRKLFCFDKSNIPIGNSFEVFGKYFLQKALPQILKQIRDEEGNCLREIKEILLNFVKYNDNSNNDFQDCYYVADLLNALTDSVIPINERRKIIDFHLSREESLGYIPKDEKFVKEVIEEIDRLRKIEEWLPSYHHMVFASCIRQKTKLAKNNLCDFSFEELVKYTTSNNPEEIRIAAFEGILILGGLKVWEILRYFLNCLCFDTTTKHFKGRMILALKEAVCEAAIHGIPSAIDDPEFDSLASLFKPNSGLSNPNNMIVVEDSQNPEISSRRDALARASIEGAVMLLRRDYGIGNGLKKALWRLIHCSLLGLKERRLLFSLCEILFFEKDIFPVDIPVPFVPLEELKKKIVARDLGDGKLVIKREGRFRIQLSTRISLGDGKKDKSDKTRSAPDRSRRRSHSSHDNETPGNEPKLKLKLGRSESKIEKETGPSVTRDTKNNMVLKLKFSRRSLTEVTTSRRRRQNVLLSDSFVTFRFFHPDNLTKLRTPPTKSIPLPATSEEVKEDTSSSVGVPRYVRFSSGKVSVSSTPFVAESPAIKTEKDLEENVKMDVEEAKPEVPKEANSKESTSSSKDDNAKDDNAKDDNAKDDNAKDDNAKDESVKESRAKDDSAKDVGPKVSTPTIQDNALKPPGSSREGSVEPRDSRGRSLSPLISTQPVKRKKATIYIHDGSRSQSRSKSGSTEPEVKEENGDKKVEKDNDKKEEDGEAPKKKPKLSLKLSLK